LKRSLAGAAGFWHLFLTNITCYVMKTKEASLNFNLYLNKKIGEKVMKAAKEMQRSRNSIISEAVEEWLGKHISSKWPNDFFSFKPIEDVPDFKALRDDLAELTDKDPLG